MATTNADKADKSGARADEPVVVKAGAKPTLTPILNRMGPRGIPLLAVTRPSTEEGQSAEVVHEARLINLPSGLSFVATPDWERAKKHKNLQIALKAKIRGTKAEEWQRLPIGQNMLVEMPPVDAAAPLGKLTEAEAIDFLEDVTDVPTLRLLERRDRRDKVVLAIRDRIKTIETKGVGALDGDEDRAAEGDEE